MRIAAIFAIVALFVVGITTTHVSMPAAAAPCDPSYPDVCIPSAPPKLNCADITYTNFKVNPPDPHGFDGDKDGIGCEDPGNGSRSSTATAGTAAASKTPGANGEKADGGCSTVFVAGKGVIDSCSNERSANSRVYPRKPGVPANGCTDACPKPADETAKPSTTPGPVDNSKPNNTGPTAFATPVPSEFTAPETSLTPSAPQNCDRVSYPDVCIPAAPPYLSCSDIPDRNFRVRAPDPHRFDADGNGIGCEQVPGPSIGR